MASVNKSAQLYKRLDLVTLTFERCQEILGKKDFERLFGGSVDQVRHLIEPSIFLGLSAR